jgi:hypothetical protein
MKNINIMKSQFPKLLIILTILLSSCFAGHVDYSNVPRLNIRESDISAEIKSSQLLKDVHLIPLETKPSSLISEIYKIFEKEGKYFMPDKFAASTVAAFDSTGKYINSYGHKGQGVGEYIIPMDFFIDDNNHELIVINSEVHKLLFYDLSTATFKREKKYYFPVHNMIKINNKFVFGGAAHDKRIIYADTNLGRKNSFLEYTPSSGVGLINQFARLPDSTYTFRVSYNDTIYKLNENGLSAFLIVDFGDKRLKIEDVNKLTAPQLQRLPEYVFDKMCNVTVYAENTDTRIISFDYKKKRYMCFQDKVSNHVKVFQADQYIDDILYLPNFPVIVGTDSGGYFMFTLGSSKVLAAYKKMSDKKSDHYSEILSNTAKRITQLNNPLLVKFKVQKF